MEQLQHLLHGQGGPPPDTTVMDTAETVYISSLALLKMLKHGTFFETTGAFPCGRIWQWGWRRHAAPFFYGFCIDYSPRWHGTPVGSAGAVLSLRC